jgi:membrane-bound serine protease (ClpP class)
MKSVNKARATIVFVAVCAWGLVAITTACRVGAQTRPGNSWVELVRIDGSINPAVADYLASAIDYGQQRGAAAIIIEIDTPGGLLSATRKIVEKLLSAPLPIISYVSPAGATAASAGTFIVEAANIAAMAPGTSIGAAHPVEMGGEIPKGPVATKIENFTVAFARSIARQRGRNEDWIESAVRKSMAIGDNDALARHVVDIVAPDLPVLLDKASGRSVKLGNGAVVTLELRGATVRQFRMTAGQKILNTLADPNLMYLLLVGGIMGLYFEFAHPGVFFPGAAGAICLLLALASFQMLPINLSGLLLILLGVALLISEVFVTSYGVLGIAGVIAFVLGSMLLVNTGQTDLAINRGIIAGAAGGLAIAIIGLGYIVMSERRGRPTTGREGMIGEIGEVREAIGPGKTGRMFIHGEIWRARADEPIAAGSRARVEAVNGLELKVSRVTDHGPN